MASEDYSSSGDMQGGTPFSQEPVFENFDAVDVYKDAVALATQEDARNFVVEFGNANIQIARNLSVDALDALLDRSTTPRDARFPVRWINIWTPHDALSGQDKCVEKLGNHYGFSRRLVALMTARRENSKALHRAPTARLAVKMARGDIEMGSVKSLAGAQARKPLPDPQVYLKDTMNYTSTDYGERFFCVGANWLHSRPSMPDQASSPKAREKLVPPKHWSWIVLCDDSDDTDDGGPSTLSGDGDQYFTVISIHEGPWYEPPPEGADPEKWKKDELKSMRSNTTSVLRQLSVASKSEFDGVDAKILELKTIRSPPSQSNSAGAPTATASAARRDGRPKPTGEGLASRSSTVGIGLDGRAVKDSDQIKLASNLFYYLFEDFMAAAPIPVLSRHLVEDLQKAVLQNGRHKIKSSAKSGNIIPRLHELSKELRQVKHLFQSYRTIVERILNSRSQAATNMPNQRSINGSPDMPVWLSHQARKRFERMDYHLQLLMLNNIEESLEESRALSETYFNLTAQKDSQATARLTRSATLLAKLSVFFLPISFQTAFFSAQVSGLLDGYTSRDYWVSFGIIAGLSFISLFFFSRFLIVSSEFLDHQSHRAANKAKSVVWDRLFNRNRNQSQDQNDDD